MNAETAEQLFARALQRMPGGVNSPVRAFQSVGGTPRFFHSAQGAWLVDSEGKRYLDYVGAWGPMILGHAHPRVIEALERQLQLGTCFGAPTAVETELAEAVCQAMPAIDKLRMLNSGTEAAMSAIRLARAHTGRDTILKFAGGYHGHADSLLVRAGSGALQGGVPDSPGVPAALARHTLVAEYNDLDGVRALAEQHADTLACILVEPVAGNMGCIPPVPGFLQGLRETCDRHGSLLIFDEVMSGFRVAPGGAQGLYGVRPDLSVLGKIIGGGLPVGALGGSSALMEQLAPAGPVYQAGTLSGNPLAMQAGLATLRELGKPGFYERLDARTAALSSGLQELGRRSGTPLSVHQVGGMFGLFFGCETPPWNYTQVGGVDRDAFAAFFHGMLERGIYFAPSPFEAGFVSAAHTEEDIGRTLEAAAEVLASLAAAA